MESSPQATSWAKSLFATLPAPRSAAEERVYGEMQRLMIRLLVPMAVINFVNGLIYSAAFLQYVGPVRVAAWFTPVVLFSAMQLLSALAAVCSHGARLRLWPGGGYSHSEAFAGKERKHVRLHTSCSKPIL